MSGHVFISYCHVRSDAAYVVRLADFLTAAGIPVWFDHQIVTGERWHAVIQQHIDSCAALVVVMTANADASTWVNREIAQAEETGKPILPLLLSGRRFFRLADVQFTDVSTGQMPPAPFVSALRELVNGMSAGPPTPAAAVTRRTPVLPTRISGRLLRTLTGHTASVSSVAIAPDRAWLATSSHDRTLRIWDAATGAQRQILSGHTAKVRSVAIAPDGTWLATGGDDATARIWDAATGAYRGSLPKPPLEMPVHSIAIAHSGDWLAAASSEWVVRWDAATGSRLSYLTREPRFVASVAIAPDGTWLAAATSTDARILSADHSSPARTLTGHIGLVESVAIAPNGTWLATASRDATVRIWDAASGAHRLTLTGHTDSVWSVAIGPDGSWLATTSEDGTTRIWDAASGAQMHYLTGHGGPVTSLAIANDGAWLATTGRDKTVRLWGINATA